MTTSLPPKASRPFLTPTKKIVIGLVVAFIVIAAIIKLTEGPASKDEICTSFDELGKRVHNANGFFDNAVFREARKLSDLADRYNGSPDLSQDAEALDEIADSNVTNGLELARASRHIAVLCGHSLM